MRRKSGCRDSHSLPHGRLGRRRRCALRSLRSRSEHRHRHRGLCRHGASPLHSHRRRHRDRCRLGSRGPRSGRASHKLRWTRCGRSNSRPRPCTCGGRIGDRRHPRKVGWKCGEAKNGGKVLAEQRGGAVGGTAEANTAGGTPRATGHTSRGRSSTRSGSSRIRTRKRRGVLRRSEAAGADGPQLAAPTSSVPIAAAAEAPCALSAQTRASNASSVCFWCFAVFLPLGSVEAVILPLDFIIIIVFLSGRPTARLLSGLPTARLLSGLPTANARCCLSLRLSTA